LAITCYTNPCTHSLPTFTSLFCTHARARAHTHTQPFNGLWSGTTWVGRYQNTHPLTPILVIGHPLLVQCFTRSSDIAEVPRDASCQLKSCQLPRNSAETTCMTSPEQIEVMKLKRYRKAMCNKHVHSTMTLSSGLHFLYMS